jgi:L,D-transpeptidase catalytic domain
VSHSHRIIFALKAVRLALAALPALLAAVSCTTPAPGSYATQYLDGISMPTPDPSRTHNIAQEDTFSYWDDDGTGGPPRIKLDLSDQAAYFYRGNHLVGQSLISSGKEGHPTPTGNFSIISKDADHVSSRYGWIIDAGGNVINKDADITRDRVPPGGKFDPSKMTWYMQFYTALGMHAGFLPGYAASHACVRMPERMAKVFFDNAPVGTPVTVVP